MTHDIVNPIAPDVNDPAPHAPSAGNWRDDDAAAYQDDFAQADHGAVKVQGLPKRVEKLPVKNDRLLVRTVSIALPAGFTGKMVGQPVMVLPADPNRTNLTLTLYGSSPSEVQYTYGETANSCFNGNIMRMVPVGGVVMPAVIPLGAYTGALWFAAFDTQDGGSIQTTAMATTS